MQSTFDVIIVGGGLQGLSSALHLARKGYSVLILEADYCGRHSSGVNAGGVRTLGRDVAEIPLALAARELIWHNIESYLGDDCGFVPSGQLRVDENESDVIKSKARVAELNALGFAHEVWVDQTTLRSLVPTISPHVVGGIWADRDGYALPYRVVTAFRLAAEKEGVVIKEKTPVSQVEKMHGIWKVKTAQQLYQCRYLVNTAGAWAAEIARQVGDYAPVEVQGLMLMVTERVDHFVNPVLGATGRSLSFKQFNNGTVVIGGGLICKANPDERVAPVDMSTMLKSAQTVIDLFPHLKNVHVVRAWGGVEAFMPDRIPVIGPSVQSEHVIHAFGFSAHGFELSPIIGKIVCDLIDQGKTDLPILPFSIGRFISS